MKDNVKALYYVLGILRARHGLKEFDLGYKHAVKFPLDDYLLLASSVPTGIIELAMRLVKGHNKSP
jgi:hypothetical protein